MLGMWEEYGQGCLLDNLNALPASGLVAVDVLLSAAVILDGNVLNVHSVRTLAVVGIYTLLVQFTIFGCNSELTTTSPLTRTLGH